MQHTPLFSLLAEWFRYPSPQMNNKLLECQVFLNTRYPQQARMLLPFTERFLEMNLDQKEELYTKTFDIQALCYLDLGYIIFGEDYKRGVFLMNMKKEQDIIGNDYLPELPDHLCHVLTLLDIHPGKRFVEELVNRIVIPAIRQNISEFESARVDLKLQSLKKKHNAILQEEYYYGNIYQLPFKVLLDILLEEYAHILDKKAIREEIPATVAFLKSCTSLDETQTCSCN